MTERQKSLIISRLTYILNYEPKIGILGKTGVGKSSLCNALFGKAFFNISDVKACTRNIKEEFLKIGDSKGIKLIDVPGIGENRDRDEAYAELYARLMPELDLSLLIQQLNSKKSLLDFSSEERSIQALEELEKYAEELGLSEDNAVIEEVRNIVDYFDINARTFHGLVFEDRRRVKQAELEAPMYNKLLDNLDCNNPKTFDEVLFDMDSLENTSGIKDSYINFIHTQKNLLILEKEYPYALIPKDLTDMFTTINGFKNDIKLDYLISRLHNSTMPEQKLAYLQSEEYQKAYELAEKYAEKEKTTFWGVVGSILGYIIIFLLISFLLGLILPGISVLIAAAFTAFSVILQIKENSDINSKGKSLWQQLTNNGQFELREYE